MIRHTPSVRSLCAPTRVRRANLRLLCGLGIGFVPDSPLGHGFLTGTIWEPQAAKRTMTGARPTPASRGQLREEPPHRRRGPGRQPPNSTPTAQLALAWRLAQGDDIAPIPGAKRVSRVEENTAADAIELSTEQIQRLNDLTPPPPPGELHERRTWPPSTADRINVWQAFTISSDHYQRQGRSA